MLSQQHPRVTAEKKNTRERSFLASMLQSTSGLLLSASHSFLFSTMWPLRDCHKAQQILGSRCLTCLFTVCTWSIYQKGKRKKSVQFLISQLLSKKREMWTNNEEISNNASCSPWCLPPVVFYGRNFWEPSETKQCGAFVGCMRPSFSRLLPEGTPGHFQESSSFGLSWLGIFQFFP